MQPPKQDKTATLYERLGGDEFCFLFTTNFFDEILENPDLQPIFKYTSLSALKSHQVKLFRVIFGPEEERPSHDEFLDFLFLTHARLFRDCKLNEQHFDMVAQALVDGLQSMQVPQKEIDEVVAILGPSRIVFEQGAKVAEAELATDPAVLKTLPVVCAKTIDQDPATLKLPTYYTAEIPDWLPKALAGSGGRGSSPPKDIVRRWTCDLTNRFGVEGDQVIADTFTDQPYIEHHAYLVSFLQLAFMPYDSPDSFVHDVRLKVKFPRGNDKEPLGQRLFDRMVKQFVHTCGDMDMPQRKIDAAVDRLRSHRGFFSSKTYRVGGIDAPHSLVRKTAQVPAGKAAAEQPIVSGTPKKESLLGKTRDETDHTLMTEEAHSVCTSKDDCDTSSTNKVTARRKFFGLFQKGRTRAGLHKSQQQ